MASEKVLCSTPVVAAIGRNVAHARVAIGDALTAEARAADAVAIGVPMYNFHASVQLKNWIDTITRACASFRYGDSGPEGPRMGKKVRVAPARGGMYGGSPGDSQAVFLKTILPFLRMTDLQVIYAEA